jgi:hypothetical protein
MNAASCAFGQKVWCAGEYGYLTELVKQSELA